MNPEIRAVCQEITIGLQKVQDVFFGGINRFKLPLACAGASVVAACAPQPTPEQAQKPREPQLPQDVAVVVVTNTPEPKVLATATSEPVPATSTSEPVKPVVEPTPFIINTPFPRYGVHAGPIFVDTPSPRNNRGYMTMVTPLDSIVGGVFSYMRDTKCSDGSSLRSGGSIKIEPRSFINQGFAQRGRFGEYIEGFMPNPNTVVGGITFPPHPGLKACGEEKVSYGAINKGNGPDDFLRAYVGLFEQAQMRTGLTTAEALAEIEKDIGGVKLPSPASK